MNDSPPPTIGQVINFLNQSRKETIDYISNLPLECLDNLPENFENSIGTLLMHVAALEKIYQNQLFLHKGLTEKEYNFWNIALPGKMNLQLIKGNEINFYIDLLDRIRCKTISFLSTMDDQWLNFRESTYQEKTNYEMLIHLIFDEMNHLGQIKLLLKRYKTN